MDEFKVPTLPPPELSKRTSKNLKKCVNQEAPENQSAEVEPKEVEHAKDQTPAEVEDKKETPKIIDQQKQNECPYNIPSWSANAASLENNYKFEVLKSGQIIEEVANLQEKAFWKFGRLPENDIVMAHPTISRFHAILQYRPAVEKTETTTTGAPEGWYIYDLESTHGTFLNKQRIPPRVYMRMRVGHMLRLGASTRSYILQGPVEDEEPESELSVTELREQRQQEKEDAAKMKRKAEEEAEERRRNEGIDWGMGEDADEETDLTHNPYASTNNEELFLDDPKKTLRGYFEREDIPLEYKCDEMSPGCFVCRVELPIDANGKPIIAEVVHKGRKKECVVQCALEACRILDRHGVLRQANQEPMKRKAKTKDSDSDDDEFWDRTGDVERRKILKANSNANVTLTYDDLVKQEAELLEQLKQVEADIDEYKLKEMKEKARKQAQDSADLDIFMAQLDEDVATLDKTVIKKLRLEQQRLKAEQVKCQRLIKIAKPFEVPYALENGNATNEKSNASKRQLPMIGKRNQFSKFKVAKLQSVIPKTSKAYASDEEEMEDDNDEESTETQANATKSHDNRTKVDVEAEKVCFLKVKGPAILPQEIEDKKEKKTILSQEIEDEPQHCIAAVSSDLQATPKQTEEVDINAKKRQRQRPRQRNKRQEVDVDELDEHESSEKYAKWIPPPNQTGDGLTPLNEKYGY